MAQTLQKTTANAASNLGHVPYERAGSVGQRGLACEAALVAEIQRRSDDWFRAGLYATSSLEAEKCRTAAAVLAQLANDLQVA